VTDRRQTGRGTDRQTSRGTYGGTDKYTDTERDIYIIHRQRGTQGTVEYT